MVQRHIDEDLVNRFSRIEQVKFERHRREKFESPEPPLVNSSAAPLGDMNVTASVTTDRCRRVLFEPDQNLLGWIDGELSKIATVNRNEWNFDFRRGVPAGLRGHKWEWERVARADESDSSLRRPTPIRPKVTSNWSTNSSQNSVSSQAPHRISKILKPSLVQKKRQKKITDYMPQRKYPRTGPASKLLPKSIATDASAVDSTENSPIALSSD